MRSMVISKGASSYPLCVILPFNRAPGVKGPAMITPNHWPNSFQSVRARQTRARGARKTTFFSMRSVLLWAICNLLVVC